MKQYITEYYLDDKKWAGPEIHARDRSDAERKLLVLRHLGMAPPNSVIKGELVLEIPIIE